MTSPLRIEVGQPLRIAVYDRIARAIRDGDYALGELLPSDAEFSASFGVSRTVVREALLLLEEDRLVRTRRGVGRFVADAVPAIGWERLRPIEQVLGESGGAAEVSRVSEGEQQASGFVAAAFGVEEEAPVWARESVLRRSGRPVCVSFECVPGDSALAAEIRGRGSSASGTLLGEFLSSAGRSVVASRCELTAGAAGAQRAAQLGTDEHAPVLVITQFVSIAGSPAYLAKHVLSPDAGAAELVQTYGPGSV